MNPKCCSHVYIGCTSRVPRFSASEVAQTPPKPILNRKGMKKLDRRRKPEVNRFIRKKVMSFKSSRGDFFGYRLL